MLPTILARSAGVPPIVADTRMCVVARAAAMQCYGKVLPSRAFSTMRPFWRRVRSHSVLLLQHTTYPPSSLRNRMLFMLDYCNANPKAPQTITKAAFDKIFTSLSPEQKKVTASKSCLIHGSPLPQEYEEQSKLARKKA